jgi:hypothetical protein
MTIWAIWDCYSFLEKSTHKLYLNTTNVDHGKWIRFYYKLMPTSLRLSNVGNPYLKACSCSCDAKFALMKIDGKNIKLEYEGTIKAYLKRLAITILLQCFEIKL